jgi:RHS repeat-associated protein
VRAHTGVETEWTWTGEQNDPNGLVYLRARYYDPVIGRFVSRDPWPGLGVVPQWLNRYVYVLNNSALFVDPYGYYGLGDLWDDARDVAGAAGRGIQAGAEAVGGGIEAGVEWLGEDYHWATVGAAVGGTAFLGGVVLLTAPVSAPVLTATLLAGGFAADVSFTTISVVHSGKQCAAGDKGACVSAIVGAACAPLGFVPGLPGMAATWAPVVTDIGVSAWHGLHGGSGQRDRGNQCMWVPQVGQGKE